MITNLKNKGMITHGNEKQTVEIITWNVNMCTVRLPDGSLCDIPTRYIVDTSEPQVEATEDVGNDADL